MMNKSKNGRTSKWKLLVFIPVAAILIISFSESKGEIYKQESRQVSSRNTSSEGIQGNWRLVSFSYGTDTVMRNATDRLERLKLITDTKFCWVHIASKNHVVVNSAGGSYSLSGENYVESLEFGGAQMKDYLGKSQKFTIKIEGNKLYLSGALSDGLKIKEVWERIGTK